MGHQHRLSTLGLGFAVAAICGCGSSTTTGTSARSQSAAPAISTASKRVPTFHATVGVTGARTVTGQWTRADTTDTSCAEVAMKGTGHDSDGRPVFDVPRPESAVLSGAGADYSIGGGHTLFLSAYADSYRGPGSFAGDPQVVSQSFDLDKPNPDSSAGIYSYSDASRLRITVNPDGSGTYTFVGNPESEQPTPANAITAAITWTCADEAAAAR